MSVTLPKETLDRLPFPPLFPGTFEARDLSIRAAGERWCTVRYLVEYNGKVFRVKEFFLDWFYTGFPKSLMSSLVDVYRNIVPQLNSDRIWFYGQNYKGRDSASMYLDGTNVEIECYSKAEAKDFAFIMEDLQVIDEVRTRLLDVGFCGRSYLSRTQNTQWWEDERISRMKWLDLDSSTNVDMGSLSLPSRSYGLFEGKDGTRHRIMILADRCFNRVSWVDVVEARSKIEHSRYNFRERSSLFDYINHDEGLVCRRTPYGPSVIQTTYDGLSVTLSFSPSFTLGEVMSSLGSIKSILEQTFAIVPDFR